MIGNDDPFRAADFGDDFLGVAVRCERFTMTSYERMYALWSAVHHICRAGMPGAIVECGGWRGGSAMVAALTLAQAGDRERELYLYDTFAGMPAPSDADVDLHGMSALREWVSIRSDESNDYFAYAPLKEVRSNLMSTEISESRVKYVIGRVEETIPRVVPDRIALLRLDTDWFESTQHELRHLWPLLSEGGILIIDDYGHWRGARRAVDEYFCAMKSPPFLMRIDYTGRLVVKGTHAG